MEKKHVIFSTDDHLDDPDPWFDLEDERRNLNVSLPANIVCIAALGLWDGRHSAWCICGSNLSNVLQTGCGDYRTWYVDDLGDLRCDDTHHDGTNHYLYRIWKPEVSMTQQETFLRRIECGVTSRQYITRYTAPIGIYAADIYGWKIRGRKAI